MLVSVTALLFYGYNANDADDPEIYDGAPVGLQIVGRKYEEEKIWAIAKILQNILESADVKSDERCRDEKL